MPHKTKTKRAAYSRIWRHRNKERSREFSRKNYLKHRKHALARQKLYYELYQRDNPKHWKRVKENVKRWKQKNPLRYSLFFRLAGIRQRCRNPKDSHFKHYGARGIKCFLTIDDLEMLWNRDQALAMKKPSIDRVENDGDYSVDNCRFIELAENVRQRNFRRALKTTVVSHQ